MSSSFFKLCSAFAMGACSSHALSEGGTGCPVPSLPPTFSKSNLCQTLHILFIFWVLIWSVEILGRTGKPFCTAILWWLGETSGLIFCWVRILRLLRKLLHWVGGTLPHVYWPQVFYLLSSLLSASAAYLPWELNISTHWGSWSLVNRGSIKKIFLNMGDGGTSSSRETTSIQRNSENLILVVCGQFYSGILCWGWGGDFISSPKGK